MAESFFVSDDDIANLGLERATGLHSKGDGPESPTDQAQRMIRENAPMAAASLLRLAQYSESDTIRLRAAIEILNRANAQGAGSDGRDPWAEVYEKTLTTADIDKMKADATAWEKRNRG